MPFIATFIVLSVLGLIDAAYLAYSHRTAQPLVCPLDHDCSTVTESKWSMTLGIRNEMLGLAFYSIIFAGAITMVAIPAYLHPLGIFLAIVTGIGILFSGFLTILQITIIKDYCFYCLISALITLFLFFNSLVFL